MTLVRRFGALAALMLTLVLGACSTPADLAVPALEPQFGTSGEDSGFNVAITTTGSIATLSQQSSYEYDPDYGDYSNVEKLIWQRYDNSGTLAWSTTLASGSCPYADCYLDKYTPKALLRAPNGNTLAVFLAQHYHYDEGYYHGYYYAYNVSASGNVIQSFSLGDFYTYDSNSALIDATVDGSGNLYVAKVQGDATSNAQTNVIAKYDTNGGLLWQRFSNVGVPRSVSVASNGNIFIGGSSGYSRLTNSGGVSWTKSGATNEVLASGTNVFVRSGTTVRKHDSAGRQLWSKAQSGLSSIVFADMTTDDKGNVYLAGKYNASSTNRNALTRKLNGSGTTVWTKTYGTAAYDDAKGIATITGVNVYVTGATQGNLGAGNQGGSDGYLRRLDVNGNPVWTR